MATLTDTPPLNAAIRSRLAQLRRRIRMYVWVEGLSLAVLWLGVTFWLGLAIDYLPVVAGATEMPRAARGVLLAIIAMVLAYLMYRWILRRAFARLPDHSMAVLLERRFGQFHDSLVTAVELAERPGRAVEFNREMLSHTRHEAEAGAAHIRPRDVFRFSPLAAKVLLAGTVLLSIGLFFHVNSAAATIWAQRLYLLDDTLWPRNTRLVVSGIQIRKSTSTEADIALSERIPFDENRELKVAKGASVVLKVKAQADNNKVIPDFCTVHYQTEQGDRGRVTMQKLGRIRSDAEMDFQMFACNSKPFRGILSSITFDVRGLDHRVRDYRLTVVPSPAIVETQLDCVFPDYLVNEELSLWLPRTVELASGTQLPMGTRVTLRSRANKDLKKVVIRDKQTDRTTTLTIPQPGKGPRAFEYAVDQLDEHISLAVTLHDTDGVVNDPPIPLYVGGIEDQPPVVNATLNGIGTAVTPDVVIPAQGEISDDYEVDKSWFEWAVNDGSPRKHLFPLNERGTVDARLDLRAQRGTENGIELKPEDKLSVTVMAADKCNLTDTPNIGSGDRYRLDVVTPEKLLAVLERKELGLRRRLEQIIDEVSEMRDSVGRLKQSDDQEPNPAPEDAREPDAKPDADQGVGKTAADRDRSLRLLRAQRALTQCDKSAQEVLGVAASFADIRQELINNRLDSKDRESRIREHIATPLRRVGETMFPELNRLLKDMERKIEQKAGAGEAIDSSVAQADDILLELDNVLQRILELETYSELMNIVRSLIKDQEELIEKTEKQRKDSALDLLE
ncbi:MAG: hypothetical protein ACQESR_18225 [Planctomycetota bacterium]